MAQWKIKKSYTAISITLGEAFSQFWAQRGVEGVVDDTLSNYRYSFTYFLRDVELTEDDLTELINKQLVHKWIAMMKTSGKKTTTINHYLRDVRTFLNWCMENEQKYIVPKFEISLVSGEEPPPKNYKTEDIQILLAKPRVGDTFGEWRNWMIVNWVMATGNREGTVVDVRVGDCNLKTKTIYLRHTKNKEYQKIPMSTALAHNITEYINLWLRGASPDDYLFPNVSGDALTTNALRHSYAKYCRRRGVEQTNLHGLRHSFADLSLDTGRSPFELQKMLGHKTLDMTRKYVNINNMKAEKDFDKHTPLDNLKKPVNRKRKIQRSN